LLGSEKSKLQNTPIIATLGIAQLPTDAVEVWQKYGHRLMLWFHPSGYFSWVGIHDRPKDSKPGEWKFLVAQSWKSPDPDYNPRSLRGDAILADAKQRAQEFGHDFKYLWQSIPDGTQMWHNRLTDWSPETAWDNHNGTVTLVGDAAHSMTFRK
jgi:2-polyprenyl-6-methoxyphenol hydroxylase-like FAD-dependent oxidoreductase